MSHVNNLTEDEFIDYTDNHPEEFLVVAVDSNLRSLVYDEYFEKFLLKSLPEFTTHPVTDAKSAAEVFAAMGFNLHLNALTGTGRMVDPLEVRVPFPTWIGFVVEVIAPMWDGVLSWRMVHMESGRLATSHYMAEDFQHLRDTLGLDRNLELEPQLFDLFEKLHDGHNKEPYIPMSAS